MFRILSVISLFLLFGCSNSVEENVGGLPNIEITGTVLNGNIRDASIQVVGIDNYGQPQQSSDGSLSADRFFTDENGQFQLAINGAASGSLLFVVSDYNASGHNTQLRCALKNGCLNEEGDQVSFGDWYDAADDFELWAVVNDAQSISNVSISPFTHLAAKLAFSDFVSNGVCTSQIDCEGVEATNGILTPQSIHEANTRVKALFNLDSNIHAFVEPYSPFLVLTEDNILAVESAKHGLVNLTLQYQAKQNAMSVKATLDAWLEDFLSNKGQLYSEDQTNSPAQWDLKTVFANAVDVQQNEINDTDAALSAAVTAFQSVMDSFTPNEITNLQGEVYYEEISEQIAGAKEFVGNVQGWLLDYENKNFSNFLDANAAAEITQMETQWEAFQRTLGPELQSVFLPIVQTIDYSLLCLANKTSNTTCTSSGSYVFDDATASVDFNGTDNIFTYTSGAQTNTHIRGSLNNFNSSELVKVFTFLDDARVESTSGLSVVKTSSADRAKVIIYLSEALTAGQAPVIERIVFDWPKLTLTDANEVLTYTAEDISLIMQGVTDPTRPSEPVHFNIESLSLPGVISSGTDAMKATLTLNFNNAGLHYPPERFPDLDFVWKSSDIKALGKFEDGNIAGSQLAGLLALPSNVVHGETLVDSVQYNEQNSYSALPTKLKAILDLSGLTQFEYGELAYPGGSTALVLYQDSASNGSQVVQCNEVDEAWACSAAVDLGELGCHSEFKNEAGFTGDESVADAFAFLKGEVGAESDGCIPQVKIQGRGVYDIDYAGTTQFTDGLLFDVTLKEPVYLGLSAFNIELLSQFKDSSAELYDEAVRFNVLGSMIDPENISLSFSVTYDYLGYGDLSSLAVLGLLPYGERTLWFAIGNDDSSTDAVIYYILDDQVSLIMTAFEYDSDNFHDEPLGYIRYANTLVGTLRKEGSLYVVRYVDGTWQIL